MITDHDGGDDDSCTRFPHLGRGWTVGYGGTYVGGTTELMYAMIGDTTVSPPHDPGDEDDYHRYLPSVDRSLGLRLWAPRDER